jgi:hypothetical protein
MPITEKRIAEIFGPGTAPDAPTTATGSAVQKIAKLDAAMAELADENREGGESRAQSYARLLSEMPQLYERYEAKKREIMAEHGFDGGGE